MGGANDDCAYSITQAANGGFAVAGETMSFGAGDRDLLVLKLASDGFLSWARAFGGTNGDAGYSITQTTDGGFAVAGFTESFGAGDRDFLVLKIGADGSYPDCVQDCSPTVMSVNPNTSAPNVGAVYSPSTSTPNLTITTPSPIMTDACEPILELEEGDIFDPWPGITCSPFPGGALFLSSGELPIKIYAADGRLVYSGELKKGENRIELEKGVYLWRTGNMACSYKGKAVIR